MTVNEALGRATWPAALGRLLPILFVAALVLAAPASLPAQTVISDAAHQEFVFAYRLLQRGEDKLAAEAFDDYLGKFPRDEKRGDGLYYRAMLARKLGQPQEAIKYLEGAPATKIVPDYAAELLKAQIYTDLKQYDKAVGVLETIRTDKLSPNIKASVLYLHGMAYRGLKNLPAAANKLQEVAQLESPLQARALLDLGRVQAMLDQPEQAVASLEQAIELNQPQVAPEAARLAGDLAYEHGDYEQALTFYELVATRYTSSEAMPAAVLGMLWTHFEAGQYRDLLDAFQQYQRHLQPADRVTAYYLAGSAQQELGQHQNARQFFEAIVDHAGGSKIEDKVLYKLAVSRFETGDHEGMAQTIASLKHKHPDSPRVADAQFLEALAVVRSGSANQGAARLTQIIDSGPEHPYYQQALLHRARLYDQHEQFQAAVADYQRYLKAAAPAEDRPVSATYSEAALRTADLSYRQGRYEQAAQTAGDLLARPRLDPTVEAEALYRQGLALIRLRNLEQAEQALSNLVDQHPASRFASEAYYYLGLIRLRLDQAEEALDDLAQAAEAKDTPEELRVNALRLMALRQQEQGRLTQAAQTAQRLEKQVGFEALQPGEYLLLGHYHIREGDPQTAVEYLNQVLTQPDLKDDEVKARALYLAAQALRDLGDTEAAVQAYHEVVALGRGDSQQARMELAQTLVEAGELEDALGEYIGLTRGEVSAETAAEATYQMGLIHRAIAQQRVRASSEAAATKAREEASKAFKRLILLFGRPELSPLPELAYLNLAELASEQGDQAAADAYYRELAQKYSDGPYAVYAKAKTDRAARRSLLERLRRQDLDPRLQERVEAMWRNSEGA